MERGQRLGCPGPVGGKGGGEAAGLLLSGGRQGQDLGRGEHGAPLLHRTEIAEGGAHGRQQLWPILPCLPAEHHLGHILPSPIAAIGDTAGIAGLGAAVVDGAEAAARQVRAGPVRGFVHRKGVAGVKGVGHAAQGCAAIAPIREVWRVGTVHAALCQSRARRRKATAGARAHDAAPAVQGLEAHDALGEPGQNLLELQGVVHGGQADAILARLGDGGMFHIVARAFHIAGPKAAGGVREGAL
jgi:hypothetical protein